MKTAYVFRGHRVKANRIDRSPRSCECGCGKKFVPWQRRQRFLDPVHKSRFHKQNSKAS